jgi:hypothetical protein
MVQHEQQESSSHQDQALQHNQHQKLSLNHHWMMCRLWAKTRKRRPALEAVPKMEKPP